MGKQVVGVLQDGGYTNLRYYVGGMADWLENGGPVEKSDSPAATDSPTRIMQTKSSRTSSWFHWLDALANWPLDWLIFFWLAMTLGFGFVYWLAGIVMAWGLQASGNAVTPDLDGLVTAIYFSFVTALSIGYGDVVPMGPLRIVAIVEGAAGLLIFGCLISKLISRHQEELVEEIHRTTFEDRLDRVRTNLHLVYSDIEAIDQIRREHSALPEQVLRRLESSIRVFSGELQTIHHLLYRTDVRPEEEALESLLGNLALCLEALIELLDGEPKRSAVVNSGLRNVSHLAREICGECVPREYAPDLKDWMNQIQELARKLG